MINIERRDDIDIVTFKVNKLNALVAEEIRTSTDRIFERSGLKVIFDLKGVDYIDSSGFGIFLSALRKARDSYSTIKITGLVQHVSELFDTLHLNTIFDICPDKEECIRSFT